MVCLRSDAIIDFRNFIEGVLDAPVYDVDGVTKLQGNQFFVELFANWMPVGIAAPFQTSANAGYWIPQEVTLPGAMAGQQIWVLVRVCGTLLGFETQVVGWGQSKPFPVVLRDSPTPLVGLESFNVGPQDFHAEREGDNLIIRWSAFGNGTYLLQSTTDLAAAGSWKEVWRGSGVYPHGDLISVTNTIVGEQRFFRLKMWRC